MFGYVMANIRELPKPLQDRYSSVYCGICRRIRTQSSNPARLALSYDMAFLALLLMSLYEPEEGGGDNACILHPIRHRAWTDNAYIRYGADMNVALAYYNAMDDYQDDKNLAARAMAGVFGRSLPEIEAQYPRQCEAMRSCIARLSELERENCKNPDLPAACFGQLMGELLKTSMRWVWPWADTSIWRMRLWTTVGTSVRRNITPFLLWEPERTGSAGSSTW